MKIFKRLIKPDLIFIFVILFFIGLNTLRNYMFRETYDSVGKVIDVLYLKGGPKLKYIYFINSEEFSGMAPVDILNSQDFLGNYYLIEVSNKNPEWSRMYLDNKILNVNIINENGFKLEKNE